MKKQIFTTLFLAGISCVSLQAQNTFPSSGNVGIGTSTPLAPLTIDGIGKPSSDNILFLKDDLSLSMDIYSSYTGGPSDRYRGGFAYGVRPANKAWQIWHVDPSRGWQNLLHVSDNGNIGLGTLNPNSRLCISDGGNGLISMHAGNTSSALGFNRNVTDGAIPNTAISAWQFTARDESFRLEGYNGTFGNPLTILKNGYMGLGINNPNSQLCISDGGNGLISMHAGVTSALGFNRNVTDGAIPNTAISGWQFTARDESFRLEGFNGAYTFPLSVLKNGNVGIGTPNPDSRLTVKGLIHAEEVKVSLQVPGPDYVFEKNYKLLSLSETETYIQQNKHLPEVPSAKEMETNGISLSEMNMLLLKKVEELTLYLIEMKKENEQIKKENQQVKTAIELLQKGSH